jgi:hypothetical protein
MVHPVDFSEVKNQTERKEFWARISYQTLACSCWAWWINRKHPDHITDPRQARINQAQATNATIAATITSALNCGWFQTREEIPQEPPNGKARLNQQTIAGLCGSSVGTVRLATGKMRDRGHSPPDYKLRAMRGRLQFARTKQAA